MPVTCFGELERRQTAQQAELGGLEELWGRGSNFIKVKIVISSISTFSEHKGRLARSFGLCVFSGESKSQNL